MQHGFHREILIDVFIVCCSILFSRVDFAEAWRDLESIESLGMVDHYTVSTIMKGLKKTKVKKTENLHRAFATLERSNLDVCSDEILLNTVIEACMCYKDFDKLDRLLTAYSKLRPSISADGTLTKAASKLRQM